MSRIIKMIANAFIGSWVARNNHSKDLSFNPTPIKGMFELLKRMKGDTDTREFYGYPIFILSAGWRSGSTLLQRLIMSDRSVLIWGEPFDHCNLVPSLMSGLSAFLPDWPPDEYFLRSQEQHVLQQNWVANLYPSLGDLKSAHRAFIQRLFQTPAEKYGVSRWGVKEVRWGIEEAQYLHWLFPDARFLFLYRNPYEAYRSYRKKRGKWYLSWPNAPIFTPTAFGCVWATLTKGFISGANTIGAKVISYENLISGKVSLDEISAYLGSHINPDILNISIGGAKAIDETDIDITFLDKYLLRRVVGPLAKSLGYYG